MYRGCQGDGDGPQFTNLTVADCSTADWDQIGGATGAWCSINLDKNNNGNYGEIKDAFRNYLKISVVESLVLQTCIILYNLYGKIHGPYNMEDMFPRYFADLGYGSEG